MRASEDKKPDPASNNSQAIAGQRVPADRDIVRQPGDVAPSVKEQLQKDIEWNRKQGYASDRDLNVQQKTERDNLMRDTFPSSQPEANAATPNWGVSGKLNYGRDRPKNGPIDASVELGVSTNPTLQERLEDEEEKKKKISPNGNGEEQEPNANR